MKKGVIEKVVKSKPRKANKARRGRNRRRKNIPWENRNTKRRPRTAAQKSTKTEVNPKNFHIN